PLVARLPLVHCTPTPVLYSLSLHDALPILTSGRWLAKTWGVDPSRETPAHELEDGNDYCPAKAPVLLGHHFSSIAGAGPINGPIDRKSTRLNSSHVSISYGLSCLKKKKLAQ